MTVPLHEFWEDEDARSADFQPESMASAASRSAALGSVSAALAAASGTTPIPAAVEFVEELAHILMLPLTIHQREMLSMSLTRVVDSARITTQHL